MVADAGGGRGCHIETSFQDRHKKATSFWLRRKWHMEREKMYLSMGKYRRGNRDIKHRGRYRLTSSQPRTARGVDRRLELRR